MSRAKRDKMNSCPGFLVERFRSQAPPTRHFTSLYLKIKDMLSSKRYSPVEQISQVDPLQSAEDALNQSSASSDKAATTHQAYSTPKLLGAWDFHRWASIVGDIIIAIFPILFIGTLRTSTSCCSEPKAKS